MNTWTFRNHLALALLAAASLLIPVVASADPPGRVARLSYLGGDVSFSPAGEDTWFDAQINRPLVVGDRLWTDQGGRVELELGTAALRLDHGSSIEFLNLNDELAQVQVTQGVLNLRVDQVYQGQLFEIDTPTLAMVVGEPGEYRIDIAPNGDSSQVTVFSGRADIYGENGATVAVHSGNSIRFLDPSLDNYRQMDIPSADDFDRWAFARNDRYNNSPSRQYVSSEMIGYADLDDHGSWRSVNDYGHVWFPRHVSPGWTPYRYGHWSWIDPWGWSWIDDAPWGFAPSHYGRWVYVSNGWGWVPGPRHLRPVYAPALVAFVGGSGWSVSLGAGHRPIGWFPLGPRDVYMPWYRVSRGYFGRVNVHNSVVVNNVYVTNVYNDYYVQGRAPRRDYTFRNAVNAVTVVPQDAFTSSRRAADSLARLRPGSLQQGELLSRAPANPTMASLAGGNRSSRAAPAAVGRSVVARNQPAPRISSFENRRGAIARNGGEPLRADQMRGVSAAANNNGRSSVRIASGTRGTPTTIGAATSTRVPTAARSGSEAGRSNGRQPAPATGISGRNSDSASRGGRQVQSQTPRSGNDATTPRVSAPAGRTGDNTGAATRNSNRSLPSSGYARQRTGADAGRTSGSRTPAGTASSRGTAPSSSRSAQQAPNRAAAQPRSRTIEPRASTNSTPQRSSTPRATTPRQQTAPSSSRSTQPAQRSAPQSRTQPADSARRQPAAAARSQSTPVRSEPIQRRGYQAPTQRSVQPSQQRRAAPAPQQRAQQATVQRSSQPSQPSQQRRAAPAPQQRAQQEATAQRRSAPAPQQRSYQAPAARQPAAAEPSRSQQTDRSSARRENRSDANSARSGRSRER